MAKLDPYDQKILASLAEEGRISWRDLAQRVGLSETPTVRRVRALEAAGFIDGYTIRVNEAAVGRPISVFVSVSMQSQNKEVLERFETAISTAPQIMDCFMMAGDTDYLMRVAVADVRELQIFLDQVLRPIPGLVRISSSFALKPVIQRPVPFLTS